jgi:hypothetical protein
LTVWKFLLVFKAVAFLYITDLIQYMMYGIGSPPFVYGLKKIVKMIKTMVFNSETSDTCFLYVTYPKYVSSDKY